MWENIIGFIDSKLSPCVKCNMFSFGCFPGVWVLIADVSEHSIGSIFKGWSMKYDLPLKMEPIQCSETSAISTQTPGKHPKENILHLTHGESLESRNLHPYGKETTRQIRLFEKLRIKRTKLLTSLTFLLRCQDHNTISRFLQIHHHIHSHCR
jgi:hypothetical protein